MNEAIVQAVERGISGARVSRLNPTGSFARAGLRVGDTITAFNGRPVRSADELVDAITQAKTSHWPSTLLTIQRGNAKGQITLAI